MATKKIQVWTLALGGSLCLAGSARAQASGAPPLPPEVQKAAEAIQKARAAREAAAAREEEALSRPTSWSQVSLDELEKSVGGRTMVEVKAQDITLEELATLLAAQSGLDIATQSQMIPAPERAGRDSQKYSFDISKRPFWEAVRAVGLRYAATQSERNSTSNSTAMGRSVFSDIQERRGQFFPMQRTLFVPSLMLAPVVVHRPTAAEIEVSKRGAERMAEMMAARRPPGQAPLQRPVQNFSAQRTIPSSPRSQGARWQLGDRNTSGVEGGGLSGGRVASSWPCLFVVDSITRNQDVILTPDASEAPAPSKPAQATPQVLAEGMLAPAAPGEWQQSVGLQMRAFIDPRVRQYRNVRFVVEEARDEAGNDLRHPAATRPRRIGLENRADINLPVALQLPRERGAKSTKATLRGALLFWVPARIATAEFGLDDNGEAARQAILWGQGADLKVKVKPGENGSWLLSSDVSLKGERGQMDFRREMGSALNDDSSYRAGLMLPGSVRAQDSAGRQWTLRPHSEEQSLTLNAGENMPSLKTDVVGAFRRARSAGGDFEGVTIGGGGATSASGVFADSFAGRGVEATVRPAAVGPDGYAYTENVTWQLEPVGGTAAPANGAAGAAQGPPDIAKIFFDAPQEWREVRVPFEFRDLPLPPQ